MVTRVRRSKVVEIPEKWLHSITIRGTIKERVLVRASRKRRLRKGSAFDYSQQLDD